MSRARVSLRLIKREGDGFALSFQAGYEQAINHGNGEGDPNQIGFGPIVEVAKGAFLLTLNPIFTKQVGNLPTKKVSASTMAGVANMTSLSDGAWASRCSGESNRSSNAGSFNEQIHSIGPTLFYNPGGGEEEEGSNRR